MKAFTIMWRVIKSAYEELFLCVGMSLLWWAGLFLVITGAPATMGIEHVANRLANYKRADSGFFWESARLHLRQGFFLFWLSVIVPPALAFNVWFYANSEGWLCFISLVWLWVLLLAVDFPISLSTLLAAGRTQHTPRLSQCRPAHSQISTLFVAALPLSNSAHTHLRCSCTPLATAAARHDCAGTKLWHPRPAPGYGACPRTTRNRGGSPRMNFERKQEI